LPDQLTLHADRGSSMKSKPLAMLLSDLGVAKTHSRPRVSNDNPYSESQFKTMKYRPDFPDFFGSKEDARACVQRQLHFQRVASARNVTEVRISANVNTDFGHREHLPNEIGVGG
jgi:transposase InsO family protein